MPLDRIDGEIIFDIDFNALEQALVGTGWFSGWEVTGSSSILSVNVSAGQGAVVGVLRETTSATNIALTAAHDTLPRKDLIIWREDTYSLTKVDGVATEIAPLEEINPRKMRTPAPPDLPSTNDILIAVVYVPPGATLGTHCTIIDKRVKVPVPPEGVLHSDDIFMRERPIKTARSIPAGKIVYRLEEIKVETGGTLNVEGCIAIY